eukprot:858773-Prymnesium_polylepis.1
MGPLWATRREAGSSRRARRADPASGPPRGVRHIGLKSQNPCQHAKQNTARVLGTSPTRPTR